MKPAEIHRPKPIRPINQISTRRIPSVRYSLFEPYSIQDNTERNHELENDEQNREFYDLAVVENEMHLRNSASAGLKRSVDQHYLVPMQQQTNRWSYPFYYDNFTKQPPRRPKNPMVHDKVFEDVSRRNAENETDSSTDSVTCE